MVRGRAASALYRAGQFFRALGARVGEDELAVLDEFLSPPQRALFERMATADQRHSLAVFHTLRARGHDEPDLLLAALLHDVGKEGGRLRLWHRVAIVLLRAFAPRWLEALGRDDAAGWRYPFFVHARHAEWGAERARAAGASPLAVALIRRHHQPPAANPARTPEDFPHTRGGGPDVLLAALQSADGVS